MVDSSHLFATSQASAISILFSSSLTACANTGPRKDVPIMTRQNRQAPGARGIPEPSTRRAEERAPQNKAAAAQLKTDRLARSLKQPVARPAHGPSMTTKAVQAKMASGVVSPRARIAPPVYRPQPIPKVLQTKSSSGQSQQTGQTQRQPVAPPVYRPEARKIAQPKAITPQRKLPTAPAINPQRIKSVVQRKPASATDTGRLAKSPPVQRPAQMRGGGQTKTAGSLVSKKPPFAPPFCGAPQKVVQAYGTARGSPCAR